MHNHFGEKIIPEQVRVAMIGAGSMANSVHYPSLASFPDVEIAAICDLDEKRLHATADKYGVKSRYYGPGFDGYQKILEDVKPDAVYAIGQPNIMYPIWRHVLDARLNLYIEKPMGITLHQAQSLAYLAATHGCITQVSFQRRTCPMVVQLYNEVLKRGPVNHAICEFYKCSPEPYLDARDHMTDDGVHAIDTLRWMCGGEVTDVKAISKRIGTPDLNFFAVLLSFDTGATGILLNSWTSGRRIFRVQMHGQGICVEAEHEGKGALYADGDTTGVWYDTKVVAGGDEPWQYGGFRNKNREFIDCVKSGGTPSSNFADAVKTMEVAERILALNLLSL